MAMRSVRCDPAARIPDAALHRKGFGMQRRKLVTLLVLLVVLAAIAMFVGGLPWDGLHVART
jgi:hypothetical protein